MAMCGGLVVGLGGFTFHYADGFSYFSNDPRACVNCRIMRDQYDSWIKGSHRSVATCNDCHLPAVVVEKYVAKACNGWNHSQAVTLQNFSEPIRITPANLTALQHNCIRCHRDMAGAIARHADVELGSARCAVYRRSTGHFELR